MKNTNINTTSTKDKNVEFFKWLFDTDNINLNSIVDLKLCNINDDPNIYIPNQIQNIINTKAMQRTGRVLQLAQIVDIYPHTYHTRLEHGIGVYNQKKEILINLYQNKDWKSNIENNNLKLALVAELIKSLCHDIGHLPLSHVLEINVIGKRDFHEDIGKRILLEDKEINNSLSLISEKLPSILKDVLEKDIFGLHLIDEGSYDIDRFDYLTRDMFYKGFQLKDSFCNFEQICISTDENGNVFCNDDNSINTNLLNKNVKTINVFPYNSLSNIEDFLKLRFKSYEDTYWNKYVLVKSAITSQFLQEISKDKLNINNELIDFLQMLKNNKVSDINIEKYLGWDDIRFYKNILDIAENEKNKNIRDFATLVCPNLEGLMEITYTNLDMKNNKFTNLSDYDKSFILKIKNLVKGNNELSKHLKSNNFDYENIRIASDNSDIQTLYNKYNDCVFNSCCNLKGYSPKEPVYIKNKEGKIFSLENHPNRSQDWNNYKKNIEVSFTVLPKLKLDNIPLEDFLHNFTIRYSPSKVTNTDLNLSPIQSQSNIENYFTEFEK